MLIWFREVRLALRKGRADADAPDVEPVVERPRPVITRQVRSTTAEADEAADPQLAAYNEYLAWLSEHPEARPGDYPAKEHR
ncbi:hypothetical protein ACFQY4_43305 [Catellatospora bangladeshensis]|uniref:hypothetical protein n=1 Tax=Catellatospora bangladeshensis TaxID=310355 RepID=UPI0036228EA4